MTDDFGSRVAAALGDGYRIERELGGGGMSRVFVAEEVALGRKVVVKVLPPDLSAGVNAERFRREIQLAASLQHPHIVPLHAAGRSGDVTWYTMPLIEGESLRVRLAREGELPIADTVRILRDVADSLTYAHEHGVVHRDIKPDNVLMSGKHAVVTDFGVAKALSSATGESSLTSVGVALGTPAYMSPEQAAADPHVDHRVDIYALGAMAYEMLSGQPPFAGAPQAVLAAHVTQTPEPVTKRRASVPHALAALVMKCLEKKAADRYATASELHQALEVMATPSGGTAPTSATGVNAPKPSLRALFTPWRTTGLALAVSGAALLLWKPWSVRAGELPLDPQVVAVLPFRVAGADASLYYLREGMMDLLHARLTGAGGLRAADVQSVVAAARSRVGADGDVAEAELSSLARQVGAGMAIQGSIVGPPENFVLAASLLAMPSGRSIARTSVAGSKDSLFVMVDHLAQRLLALGAGESESRLSALTTTSLEALRAYLDGQVTYRKGSFSESLKQFERAIELDSTFALAASAAIEGSGWAAARLDMTRVRNLAWRYRDRLHPTDREILAVRLGSRWPAPTSYPVRITDRDRLTQLLPESPLAWYALGDAYYHFGALSGFPDWADRAARAFEVAASRDSLFAAPAEHLATLAATEGNVAALRRWANRRLALDTASSESVFIRTAYGLMDPESPDRRWAEARIRDSVTLAGASGFLQNFSTLPFLIERADTILARAMSRDRQASRPTGFTFRAFAQSALGHEAAARRLVDSLFGLPEVVGDGRSHGAVWVAVAFGLEDSGLVASARRTRSAAFQPSNLDALWDVRHGDPEGAARIVAMLRSGKPPAVVANPEDTVIARAQLAILEAAIARAKNAANAAQLLAIADTAAAGFQLEEWWALLLSELNELSGNAPRALAALDRAVMRLAQPQMFRLIERLRAEGRLAAQLGQRDRAIRAYGTYLLWRANPDPELIAERNQVRAELARLEGRR